MKLLKELKGVFYRNKHGDWRFESEDGKHYVVSNVRPFETNLRLLPGYHDNTRGSVVIIPNGVCRVKSCN